MLKRGRVAAAQPGAGREGVKKEKQNILVAKPWLGLVGEGRGAGLGGHTWPAGPRERG